MENENYESFEGDFEGFEDDYESGIPESPSDERDALTSGEDELSQIVRLINGEDIDTSGSEAKRTREFSTTNIGADGRRDFSSQSDAPAPTQQAPAEPQTIYAQQVTEVKNMAQQQWDEAHREAQRLQDLYESGSLSAEDHYRLSYEQGVKASQSKEAMYLATIQEFQHAQQQQEVHNKLQETLGDAWSPENRDQTMTDIVEWARSKNLGDDLLHGVENEHEALALYTAMNNERELERVKTELHVAKKMMRKQHQQLKGRRVKQSKDAQTGQRNRDTIDQVADLLAQNGHGHTGRKR